MLPAIRRVAAAAAVLRVAALAPEQWLMIAVVQDAINCIEKYRFATDPQGQRFFNEVMEWLDVDEPDWPYSFESIRVALGLDADAARQRLQAAQEQPPGRT